MSVDGNGKNGEMTEFQRQVLAQLGAIHVQLIAVNAKADEANRKADEALAEIGKTNAELRNTTAELRKLREDTNSELGKTNAELRNTSSELRELRQEMRQGFRDVDIRLDELKLETIGIRIATQRTVEHMSRDDEDLRTRVTRIEEHIGLRSP